MHTILIVDFSMYKKALEKVFREEGYHVLLCDSAYEAMAGLKSHDIDLIVSEIELPGDNAFDLYNYITKNYPYIPTIMTTDKNIDHFFDRIFREGIGNVLCKPIKKDEILNLAERLITKENIFCLHNYIRNIRETKKICITASKQIKQAVDLILEQIDKWGFPIQNRMSLNLVLNEMTINAVYHSHGYTKEKEARIPITLSDGECVELFFARSDSSYGISINDYNGKLSKQMILNSINRVIEQDLLLREASESGRDVTQLISETGRGIDLVRKLSGEYYFVIQKDIRTEIMLIFDTSLVNDDVENHSSLKIIEDI